MTGGLIGGLIGGINKPPKAPKVDIPTAGEIQAIESAAERKERIRRSRGVTSKKTLLTSALGAPIGDQNVFRPTLGAPIAGQNVNRLGA